MIGELPESCGNNAILVVVDRISKCIHAIPTVTSLDSKGVAQLFLENVWWHHGLPNKVVRTSSLLQVQLSIQSGLGLSLQAGPSVTGSLGSDVAK